MSYPSKPEMLARTKNFFAKVNTGGATKYFFFGGALW